MRVLVIEDEVVLREQLSDFLKKEGYATDSSGSGEDGLFLGLENPYDIAVVDIGLPDITGLDVIKQLRENDKKFPIIILTARGRWQEKVEGLEAGADDYLVKPFHYEELLARVKALVRRSAGFSSPVITSGPLVIDTSAQSVKVDGEEIELTAYEYKTLEYLVLNNDKVISKTELTEHIYDQDFDRDSNVIEVFVGRLRKKLDPHNTFTPIATLRGRGYKFNLPVE
ncbi:MAG: response regulator transcription factor [Gammaproteobacteria bacterium]|nr:response regulator transcription factor [Gammaproteobacteria bacterium]